jgi:hypothetical protein
MKNLSIDALFEIMRKILLNLQEDASLQQKMNGYGFPADRIQEGHALLLNAMQLHDMKDDQYHEWLDLSKQVQEDRATALETFVDHVQVARVAFRRQPKFLRQLKINKVDRSRAWEWTVQAARFYGLITAYAPMMKQHGILPEELQQAKAGIEALLAMKARTSKRMGEAKQATQARNTTLEALSAWLVEFRAAARLAFKDTPKKLEAFGIKPPS